MCREESIFTIRRHLDLAKHHLFIGAKALVISVTLPPDRRKRGLLYNHPRSFNDCVTRYDRTPPCSEVTVTQCSQYYHDVQVTGLQSDKKYHYKILAANGTTESDILTFKTARAAGDSKKFSIAVLNDMG
jgi:purple acid phosphatase-like protein